jgi:uncharacterized protein
MTARVEIHDVPNRRRYEASLDGSLAGFLAYEPGDGRLTIVHTEVDPAFEGHGIGSSLARYALDDARSRGLRVTVLCPFVTSWLRRHREYVDIVDRPTRSSATGPE